jgi:5-methylcytosine-specific restriction endonuclease McrA
MGKTRKREIRKRFRDSVFARDGYKCVVCGKQSSKEEAEHDLDAHHITPREDMPNGGYVKENGVSLCDPSKRGGKAAHGCHYKAEEVLNWSAMWATGGPKQEGDHWFEYSPEELYKAVGSSKEEAIKASEFLK